jgi:hypothetical protein
MTSYFMRVFCEMRSAEVLHVQTFTPLTLKHHGAIMLRGGMRSGGGGVT